MRLFGRKRESNKVNESIKARAKKRENVKKPLYSVDLSAFTVDIFFDERDAVGCYAEIRGNGGIYSLRISGSMDAYGLLMSAAEIGDNDCIEAYCTFTFLTASFLATDEKFIYDLHKIVGRATNRGLKEGEKRAEQLKDVDEEAAQVFMEGVAEFADKPAKEQRKDVKKTIKKLKKSSKSQNKDGK